MIKLAILVMFGKDLMMTWMVGFHKRGSPVSENIYPLFATTFHNTLTSHKIIKVSLLRQNGFISTVTSTIDLFFQLNVSMKRKWQQTMKDGCDID